MGPQSIGLSAIVSLTRDVKPAGQEGGITPVRKLLPRLSERKRPSDEKLLGSRPVKAFDCRLRAVRAVRALYESGIEAERLLLEAVKEASDTSWLRVGGRGPVRPRKEMSIAVTDPIEGAGGVHTTYCQDPSHGSVVFHEESLLPGSVSSVLTTRRMLACVGGAGGAGGG